MCTESVEDKPVKVLWLTSSYPRSKDDSASVFLRYLAEALANQKVSLHILSADHPEVVATTRPDDIVCHHFRYFWPRKLQMLAYGSGILPNLRAAPWLFLQIPFFILSMYMTAVWLLFRTRPALIHAHWIFPQGLLAVMLGKLFRIPVIVTAHGGDAFALKGRLLGVLKHWTIKKCAAWTSNTLATAAAVGHDLPKPYIIPMGIDYRRFAAGNGEALRARRDPQKLVLLFVGRLVEKKGVADLLTAITCLSKDVVERIELWIIGHGTEFDRLTVMAVEYGIKDKVVFYGRLPNEQLPDFYAAADIFIAPSIIDADGDTEGQGVIFLEAMASGIPVIGTRTGGVAEMIDHGNTGLLVAPNHVDQLAAAIERLIADEPFRAKLGEAGQRVAECHDWQLLATKFIALYLSVVDNQRR